MKLRFGLSSIIGLSALLATFATQAHVAQAVQDGLTAARLAPSQKFVVQTMAQLAALEAAPGDIVTVVTGVSGGREVREVIAVDANGQVSDSIVIERERSVEVPVTEVLVVGEDGALALGFAPANGLASIGNFGNVLHTGANGESALYGVSLNEAGSYVVDTALSGESVKIQYSRLVSLAVSEAAPIYPNAAAS